MGALNVGQGFEFSCPVRPSRTAGTVWLCDPSFLSFTPLIAVIFVLPPEFLFLGSCFLLAACESSRGSALLALSLMTRPSLCEIAAAQLTFYETRYTRIKVHVHSTI